jgi:hypothetical protein
VSPGAFSSHTDMSQVIWEDLSRALHAKDMKAAGKIKNRIEQKQRDVAKAMSGDFEPIFFRCMAPQPSS